MPANPLRIGIAGLGTVGAATLAIAQKKAVSIAQSSGRDVQVIAVSARDKNKKRECDTSKIKFVSDAVQLANDADIDVVVELIGGADGIAYTLVKTALENKKSVVTANKALIAKHGIELAAIAEKNNVTLAFEAAVAGGIPVLKTLRQGLAANRISRVTGILNGTCNYILTNMWQHKRSFADMLAEAQKLGYAEADPTFDVDGIDTAHKLAILASLAFGAAPELDAISIEGIRQITLADMQFADELGYAIKLLGIAQASNGAILQRVHPAMVAKNSALANVHGVFNAVQIEGDSVGSLFLEGRGAGGDPTASAVVADIIDIARNTAGDAFGRATQHISKAKIAPLSELKSSYYVRLSVIDKPGVLADITSVFRDAGISLKSFLQHGHAPNETVSVVVATHEAREADMQKALATIAAQSSVKEPPLSIRIEE